MMIQAVFRGELAVVQSLRGRAEIVDPGQIRRAFFTITRESSKREPYN
jgi:hypothetical protein